jgi:hypothetical protein
MTLLLAEALLGSHHIEMQLHGKELVVSLLHTKSLFLFQGTVKG